MKYYVILMTLLVMFGCHPTEHYKTTLEGNHELHKLFKNEKDTIQTPYEHTKGGGIFILGIGGGSYKSESGVNINIFDDITFSWKDGYGNYILSTVPSKKVRIHTANVDTPYVRFGYKLKTMKRLIPQPSNTRSGPYFDESPLTYVDYVVIYCREEHYPYNVNLDKIHE